MGFLWFAHEFSAKQCNSTFRRGPYPLCISLRCLFKIRSFPFLRGWGRVRSDGWGSSSCLVNWTSAGAKHKQVIMYPVLDL